MQKNFTLAVMAYQNLTACNVLLIEYYMHAITRTSLHVVFYTFFADHSSFLRRNPLDEPREITTFLPYDSRDVDTLAISRRLIAVHEPSQIKHQLDPAANRQK